MAEVILEKVSKRYANGIEAVRQIDLEIKDHEFMVLVGPSGCGKSTTLRMIAGLEEVSSGIIRIGERVVNNVLPKDRDIAMVFQNYALYPHMTVYENMAFGLQLRGISRQDIDYRVREAAKILNIEDVLERRPAMLSGGQQQRVAVGRAIVRKAKAFLFDEPLSNLDVQMRTQMRIEIARLHQQLESTMIYVTHDQMEALTLGSRICVMRDGVVQQVAEPIALYETPANKFVAGFIGSPPMNFIDGNITENGGRLIFSAAGLEFEIPVMWQPQLASYKDREVSFGIRPENIGSREAAELPNSPELQGQVEVIEPMGAENHVYLNTGAASLIARLDTRFPVKVGMPVALPVHLPKAHFFDPVSEVLIV
ncbi:MAG: sn-glycerol-3-phosphate ABC transporter ATP-binding protein UgpC [Lentisphaeria bacterium]|nr:sn-glycerol-3-phosphate ABC transporter ATP-binding protein UgpC [Lentisphaeria bacterium]